MGFTQHSGEKGDDMMSLMWMVATVEEDGEVWAMKRDLKS